jgi:hypothetical protein
MRAARVEPTQKVEPEHHVTFRTAGGVAGTATLGAKAAQAAMALAYIVRNRRRWADREDTLRKLSEDTSAMLASRLGVSEAMLRAIAAAGIVEVEVPYEKEAEGWEGRIMPWEYALSGATRPHRYGRPLTVFRRLLQPNGPATPPMAPGRLLFVETAPCGLREGYTFDYERKLVQDALGAGVEMRKAQDPTRGELEAIVREFAPDVIHVTGFDNHQGLTFLDRTRDERRKDGVLLRAEDNGPDPVPEQESARLLTCADRKPTLVSLNLFNSAARTAPLIVAAGTSAAIGFQDEFSDPVAELFFATLYRTWATNGWQLHDAFATALRQLRGTPEGLKGTGVALWSSYSAFEERPTTARRAGRATRAVTTRGRKPSETPAATASDVRTPGNVEVRVEPFTQFNYSMLHNNREMFDVFLLRNFTPDTPREIYVKVTLFVCTESYPCENSFSMPEAVRDLSSLIHVPLISSLGRSVREAMRTSLFVEVKCDGVVRHCKTYPVTLLPIDEWRDDDDNRHWLPSFVLPRDPAVPKIVDAAQRYLMALTDDPTAGFDGYQSVGLSETEGASAVDRQVQAIWSVLLYDLPLSYINPPPTFTASSQRLRAPTEVIAGKRGTCIDLALLLASCLEYVDIHPVIILLEGHCFPGYWRTEKAHDEFERVRTPEAIRNARASELREVASGQTYAWLFDGSAYRELLECVEKGNLVLIETVNVTTRTGFNAAVAEATEEFKDREQFHSMMDVWLARERNVTPLPVVLGG